jgi:hypothetical protein
MINALALGTLFLTGAATSDCLDSKVLPLKAKLIDFLAVGSNCKHDEYAESSNGYNPWSEIYKIKDRLSTFAETTVGSPGALMHLIQPDVNNNLAKALPTRRELVSKHYFGSEERVALARLVVKDVDRYSYKMHCKNEYCGCITGKNGGDNTPSTSSSTCEFRLVSCPNTNCPETFSFKYSQQHDEECGFKLLPCPSNCGMSIPRNEVHIHVRDKCVLRAAECPLACLGCTTVVQAQDVARHLNEHSDQHFLFVANRMMEYQTMIKKLNAKMQLLEEKNAKLELEIQGRTAQVSTKKDTDVLSNEVKKLTKRIGTLEGTCKTEFKKVEQDRRSHKK